MKTIIKETLKSYDVSLQATRVGIVLYGENAEVVSYLKDSKDSVSLLNALDSLEYPGDGSNVNKALITTNTDLFTTKSGARVGVGKVILLFVDKKSDEDPAAVAQSFTRNGIKIITIGVGSDIDKDELKRITSDYRKVIVVEPPVDKGKLKEITKDISSKSKPGEISYFSL